MSEYEITIKEKTKYGCCNMVIWDAIFAVLFAVVFMDYIFPIHTAFRIMIGLGVAILLQWLYRVKFLGLILHILAGLFYQMVIWAIIEEWILQQIGDDQIWYWTIRGSLGLICIGMHIGSYEFFNKKKNRFKIADSYYDESGAGAGMGGNNNTLDIPRGTDYFKQYDELMERHSFVTEKFCNVLEVAKNLCENSNGKQTLIPFFESIVEKYDQANEKIETYIEVISEIDSAVEHKVNIKSIRKNIDLIESCQNEIQNKLNQLLIGQKGKTDGVGFSLFAGCDTVEKLKSRYKNLSKNYHPDTDSGDTQAMQTINQEYERLLSEFSSKTET
ncbi:MAG: hypothetical protein FWH08_05050 [Oscillospiraceae bacterium]|nr:hypothetical protein [Oscillospiraceae bacterium]